MKLAAWAAMAAGCQATERGTGRTASAPAPGDRTAIGCSGTTEEDGYRLWLRYDPLPDAAAREGYRALAQEIVLPSPTPTLVAARKELGAGLAGLLGDCIPQSDAIGKDGAILAGTPRSAPAVAAMGVDASLGGLGPEGFLIRSTRVNQRRCTVVAAAEDRGVLYGVFHLLRHLQTGRPVESLAVESAPRLPYRVLDHWDNLDRTVERGYAGFSIWDWHKLPDYLPPQYEDYARACASVGINGASLTNVNADALVLTAPYIEKIAALAGVFRPYGVRVYLTARFSAPIEIGGLATADPLDAGVVRFWRDKADAIYGRIPDFGGFLVKANAEGQPGPQDYHRSHAEGANVLADAVRPHGGIVVWRAFVYTNRAGEDRAKQAYDEFEPLDGAFRENAFLQVKNGPIDFQPREPFHPLFGAMKRTPMFGEFQLTQEYLGCATHLAYLATMFQETLDSDTYARGPASTVAKVLTGEVHGTARGGMAGVANIGTDRNWCGHPFAQANWYAFGRLAWDPALRSEAIADGWIRMTFTHDEAAVARIRAMMMGSREAIVDYMTPLGLHHIMATDHHYGPGPWIDTGRPDWTPVYYHRADDKGLGFDRSATGSDAVAQYAPPVARRWGKVDTCPEDLLLWFHHVPWDRKMRSGRTLWDELCHKYGEGVSFVRGMQRTWAALEGVVDPGRHRHVSAFLRIQEREARWWRDACLLYFQTFAKRPLPAGEEPLEGTLEGYMKVRYRYVPGLRCPASDKL